MKVLVACEYSGIVWDAFIALGHDAMSCDPLPTEKPGPHYMGDVFDVINERYENLRPTIILSNLTTEEIRAYLGDRVYDRLRENGGKAFVFDWDSYRGKAA